MENKPIDIIMHTDDMFTEVFKGCKNSLDYVINLKGKRIFSFGGLGLRFKSINTSYFSLNKKHTSEEIYKLWTKDKKQQIVDFHKTYILNYKRS